MSVERSIAEAWNHARIVNGDFGGEARPLCHVQVACIRSPQGDYNYCITIPTGPNEVYNVYGSARLSSYI